MDDREPIPIDLAGGAIVANSVYPRVRPQAVNFRRPDFPGCRANANLTLLGLPAIPRPSSHTHLPTPIWMEDTNYVGVLQTEEVKLITRLGNLIMKGRRVTALGNAGATPKQGSAVSLLR